MPQAAFGLAFSEASGACLIRADGNDDVLKAAAVAASQALAAGHTFVLYLRNAYPINVLNRIKDCPEVCRIFCATANPLQVIVARSAGFCWGVVRTIDIAEEEMKSGGGFIHYVNIAFGC